MREPLRETLKIGKQNKYEVEAVRVVCISLIYYYNAHSTQHNAHSTMLTAHTMTRNTYTALLALDLAHT